MYSFTWRLIVIEDKDELQSVAKPVGKKYGTKTDISANPSILSPLTDSMSKDHSRSTS